MPRNGSGTYSLPTNSWNPIVSGQVADASDGNQTLDDIADALTESISTDGSSVVTDDINFAGFQLLQVGGVRIAAGSSAAAPALYPAGLGQNDGIYFGGNGNTHIVRDGSIVSSFKASGASIYGQRGTQPAYNFQDSTSSAPTGFYFDSASSFVLSRIGMMRSGIQVLNSDGTRVYINAITNDAGATPLGMTTNGVYRITSSRRWKDVIGDLEPSMGLLRAMQPRNYYRLDDNGEPDRSRVFSGFIAEEVYEALPGLVNMGADGLPESLDTNGILAELWAIVQQMADRLDELEAAT